jgi:hypothetical protein
MRFGSAQFGRSRFGDLSDDDEDELKPEKAFLGNNGVGSRYLGQGDRPFGVDASGDTTANYPAESYPDLTESVAPNGPSYSRDRLDTHLKKPFEISDGDPGDPHYTHWDGFLDTFASEIERIEYSRDEVSLARHVDFAQIGALDKLGDFVLVDRKQGEPDRLYRERIKMELRVATSGGTMRDIKEASASVLGTDPSRIRVGEDFPDDPAEFRLGVPRRPLDSSEVSLDEFVNIVQRTKAAGVGVFGYLLGGFEYRTELDYKNDLNDPDKAYTELDDNGEPKPDLGGEYASLINSGEGGQMIY